MVFNEMSVLTYSQKLMLLYLLLFLLNIYNMHDNNE
jgi:hypothetical protein